MRCFHGTTLSNFKTLMTGGDKEASLWFCSSEDGLFYVYPADKVGNTHGVEREDFDSQEDYNDFVAERGRESALESALLTASFVMSDTTLVVLELEIDESLLEDDWSCNNMSGLASFIDSEEFTPEMVTHCWTYTFKGFYSPFFIPVNNENTHTIPPELEMMAKAISDTRYSVWEDLHEAIQSTCEEIEKDVLLNS